MAMWETFGSTSPAGDLLNTIREDLLDFITNIDPVDTPLFSMTATVPASSTKHEWITDTLAALSVAGAVEGAAFTSGTLTQTTRLDNYTQILKREFEISGSNEAVNHAGMSSQSAYQSMKAMKELARNTEASLIQGARDATSPQGSSSVARTMDGLSVLAGNTQATASNTSITEDEIVGAIQLIWDDGANADTILANADLKKSISALTTVDRIHHSDGVSDPGKIVRNIQTYESDFGTVNVFLERHCAAADQGYVFERQYLRKAILRPTRMERLAKVGDSERYCVLHELTLEVLAPNAVCKFS
jgi:hypothetical protein